MPRSSRHKSSKHSSKEAREHSDSEKDTSLKEKKPREGSVSRHGSRESASGEKRKHDTKAVENKELIDFVEEYSGSSSKKRREKVGGERWTGESNELEQVKVDKDSKGLGESKSRSSRWDDSPGFAGNMNDGKRSGSKTDSKHHKSERKERGDRDELETKSKDGVKNERFLDAEVGAEVVGGEGSSKHLGEEYSSRDVAGNSGRNAQDDILNHVDVKDVERRVRRKKDNSSDVDKYQDMIHEFDVRQLPAKDDIAKSVKHKEDGDKDERHKDKYRDDAEKDYYHQEGKQQRDSRHSKDHVSTRVDDKHYNSRTEKKERDTQTKKFKSQDVDGENDRGRYHRRHDDRDERDHEVDRDNDRERGRDHDRDRGRDVDHDRGKDIDRDRERGRERERDRDKDGDRDRERERYRRDREMERDRTRDRDHDNDWEYNSHVDRRSSGYREDRSRRRSPDDYDDYCYNERPKRVRAEGDTDKERSVIHRAHAADAVAGSSRGRSPAISKSSHVYTDKYRDNMLDDMKYGDSREGTGFLETPEKYSRYHYADKHAKLDAYRNEDPSAEKSPGTKASPLVRIEKSPSTSMDHKYAGRPSRRRSIDIDEAERRSSGSNDVIEGSGNDDRQNRDLTSKRSMGEDYSPAESSFHHKSGHGNWSSLGHAPLNYRAGADSPFMGLMGEDSRGHSGRYRRSVDPNVGRPHGNPWKGGVHHWASPMSNGFMHFPPGPHGPPPHGVFPGMLPQFPSPPIFALRPPMELNHAGIPYHLPDADRFPGHLRPVGWPNIMDGMGPPFHGWDGNNSLFREEIPFYGTGNMSNGRPRDAILEPRKQNVDMNSVDATPGTEKDVHMMKSPGDEAHAAQYAQEPGSGQHEDMEKDDKWKISSRTADKEAQEDRAKVATVGSPEFAAVDNAASSLNAYLCKLDVSIQLTDPDLYNEYVNLAIFGPSDDIVKDKKDNMEMEEASEILLEPDTCLELPLTEDSIFQRAIELYKLQSFGKGTFMSLKFPSSSLSSEVEDTERVLPEVGMRDPVLENNEAETSSGVIDIGGSACDENEGVATPVTKEMQVSIDSPNLSKLDPDVDSMNPAAEVASGYDGVIHLAIDSDTQMETVGELRREDLKGEEEEQTINAEEADVLVSSAEVSGQLILSRGSSSVNKVCEALVPPNESTESVIITRIPENDPESTH